MMRRIIGVFVFILGALSCANAQFQIRFIKDRVYDEMAVYQMLKMYDPAGLESRAGSMDIDLSLAEIIHNSKNIFTAISMTNKIVSVKYKQHSDEIDKSKKEYSSSWKLMINDFSTQIQRITEHKWFYPEYICVVSPINTGVSNWYGNKIIRHSNLKSRTICS
jgi:hypothetical protein